MLTAFLAAAVAACTLFPSVTVSRMPDAAALRLPPVNAFNYPERLGRLQVLEVLSFLERIPEPRRMADARLAASYGRALLARGDLAAARRALGTALPLEAAPAARAEVAWALAQTEVLADDFRRAAGFVRQAIENGHGLSPGFARFLEAFGSEELYSGPVAGEQRRVAFERGAFDLVRLPAEINGMPTAAVLDTGASYSIIIQSLARRAGVREIPGATGFGRGLHNREIPLTYGVLDGLAFAGYQLKNVPVLVMPDDALLFETRRGRLSLPMVLGLHLLKEFAIELEYEPAQVTFVRADAGGPKVDPMQNLFYFRGRIFARASVNLTDPSLFLFDTGSEGTLMTSAGLSRLHLSRSFKLYPRPLSGIGQSRVEWGRLRRVSIGVDRFLISFRDLAVREDDAAFEDGILGASAMKPFRTRIDFGTMRLVLEERESWAGSREPGAGSREPNGEAPA